LFSHFKPSKYLTPPLICKYIAQIIYFPSILSPVFALSHAMLKETTGETGLFSGFTRHKLEWMAYNIQVFKSLPPTKKKHKAQIKFPNLESLIFHGGYFIEASTGGIFWTIFLDVYIWFTSLSIFRIFI